MSPKPAPDKPQWETVPHNTPASTCTGKRRGGTCEQTVYWIERPKKGGKPGMARIPVDCDVEGGQSPDSLQDGRGVSHFQTCDDVGKF